MKIPLGRYWSLLATYLKPQWPRVLLLGVLLFGGIGLQLLSPQIIRHFIDVTQANGSRQELMVAAALFIIVAVTYRVAAVYTAYIGESVGWTATNALRTDLARHCLRLDMAFHRQRTPGEMIERIDGDVTQLGNFLSQLVIRLLGYFILIVAVLLLLFREDWRVGTGLTLYAIATLLALGAIQKLAVPRWAALRQADAESSSFLEERMSGTEDIRANGAVPYVMRRLDEHMLTFRRAGLIGSMMGTLSFSVTHLLYVVGYTLGLGLGVYLYLRGQVTIGTAYLITYYIGMLSGPLEGIRRETDDLQAATASIDRVDELFRTQSTIREALRASLPAGVLGVEFQHVDFGYEENENLLHDVSFRLERGSVLGVLGRTGSGKTTLTRLLFRLYDPSAGVIRLDGVDIRDARLSDVRSRVGMVTQDVQLFQASIRDNLTFFNKRISDGEVLRVLRQLGLWSWLESLPDGLDTRLEAGGQGLSAGEAQLLAFARVFFRDPGLVVLDEASSRLDPATEQLLEQAMDQLLQERTGIIIAHRLATVRRADDILILEDGRVREYGPRQVLASDPTSRFCGLLRAGLEDILV